MRRAVGILGLLLAVALTVGACGGDSGQESGGGGTAPETMQTTGTAQDTEPTEVTEAAKTLPEQPGKPLTPGKYVTGEFEPAFSFRLDRKGWQNGSGEIPDSLDLFQGVPEQDSVPRTLAFDNPEKVYDPQKLPKQIVVAEPEDWVTWFQNHPYLDITKPEPASVGSVSGVRFTVKVTSAPKDYPEYCPKPCVSVYPLSDGSPIDLVLGDPDQITVVEVGDETVLVYIGAPEKKFEEFFPVAQDVLDTVEWKAPQ